MDGEADFGLDGSAAFFAEQWDDVAPKPIKGLLNFDADDMPCRIGIAGSHGVGKSTLANAIAEELNIPIIENLSRTAKKLGYTINKKSDINSQLAIWIGQLYEQVSVYNFVCDRTIVDHYAYLTWLNRHNDLGIDRYLVTALGNLTESIVNEQYAIVFYVPISYPIESNGVRSTDKKYQKEIDQLVLHFLNSWGVEYMPLPGTHDQKFNAAMNYIRETGLDAAAAEDD